MAVSYRFIYSLEVAIKDREGYYSNLGKNLRDKGGRLFSSKTEISICSRTDCIERGFMTFS